MAPPDYPGMPSRLTPGLEMRPKPANPPPPESLPPGGVAVSHGKWRLSMTPVAALVVVLCAACAAVGYFASLARRPASEDATGLVRDVRAELAAQKQAQADAQAAILHRLDGIETQVSRLQDSQDRLRERVNDRLAHP